MDEIIITPDMEITRGTTTYGEYCYTHYIVFYYKDSIYITGKQNSWKTQNGNVVVDSSYTLRLARNWEEFKDIPLDRIQRSAYNAYMTGAR